MNCKTSLLKSGLLFFIVVSILVSVIPSVAAQTEVPLYLPPSGEHPTGSSITAEFNSGVGYASGVGEEFTTDSNSYILTRSDWLLIISQEATGYCSVGLWESMGTSHVNANATTFLPVATSDTFIDLSTIPVFGDEVLPAWFNFSFSDSYELAPDTTYFIGLFIVNSSSIGSFELFQYVVPEETGLYYMIVNNEADHVWLDEFATEVANAPLVCTVYGEVIVGPTPIPSPISHSIINNVVNNIGLLAILPIAITIGAIVLGIFLFKENGNIGIICAYIAGVIVIDIIIVVMTYVLLNMQINFTQLALFGRLLF